MTKGAELNRIPSVPLQAPFPSSVSFHYLLPFVMMGGSPWVRFAGAPIPNQSLKRELVARLRT